MDITCPKCEHGFRANLAAIVPDTQKIVMRIELNQKDQFIAAKTLGGVITQNDRLLKAVARNIGGPVEVFVSGMSAVDGEVRIEFLIVKVAGKRPAKKAQARV